MEETVSRALIKVEILTANHQLLGYVTTAGRRLSDVLNLADEPAITLDSATVKPLGEARGSEVSREFVLVNKETILATVPRESSVVSMATERAPKPLEYVERMQYEVVVSLPPLALRGHMHLAKTVELRDALATFQGSFIPLSKPQIVYILNPKLLWEGDVVLINRHKAQLYWSASDLEGR